MIQSTPSQSPQSKLTIASNWRGSALKVESTLHQLAPYIGKLKSSIAASLVSHFTAPGDTVYDPFSGSGTVALEAWSAGRHVIANDFSDYAVVLTRAKLFPSPSPERALSSLDRLAEHVEQELRAVDLRRVPIWVRQFFHPETLRETIAWAHILIQHQQWFLLASLLGILHHQRPGFLSYPCSHTVPYLRARAFPRNKFPELYDYRSVESRLRAKIIRAFRRFPSLDYSLKRQCYSKSAALLEPGTRVDAIITSPPYMRQLDYARDNRLRLWFLGIDNHKELEPRISPTRTRFLELMTSCFERWKQVVKPGHCCVLVVGDTNRSSRRENLSDVLSDIAVNRVGGYSELDRHTELIPNERRVRRGLTGTTAETILVLRNDSASNKSHLR